MCPKDKISLDPCIAHMCMRFLCPWENPFSLGHSVFVDQESFWEMATCLFDFNWWLCAVEAPGNCFTSPVAPEESDGKASQSASTASHACPCSQSSAFSASSRSGIPSKKVAVSALQNDCLRSLTKQLAFSSASMDNRTSHRSSRWCNTRQGTFMSLLACFIIIIAWQWWETFAACSHFDFLKCEQRCNF